MDNQLKYMPVLRSKREEKNVLLSFNYGDNIYPCIEIIKESDTQRAEDVVELPYALKKKNFADYYMRILGKINARHVFVDLPIHLNERNAKKPIVDFFRSVVANRIIRTEYLKELIYPRKKVIPIISSYWERTNEPNSIILQANDLRPDFAILAFRTFSNLDGFNRDIIQIRKVIRPNDYLIIDWGNMELDNTDGDQQEILDQLKLFKANIIIHKDPIPKETTNVGLPHGEIVNEIDNSHIDKYTIFNGTCFSDYAGIKKDTLEGGGMPSPGFVYYDAVKNLFYGFRFKNGGHKKGQQKPKLEEFELTIIPGILSCPATQRMQEDDRDFLGGGNLGWAIITDIDNREEKGKSAAKFKRIGMEHYLHCIRTRIENGDFD